MSRLIIATEYIDGGQNSTGYYWSRIISGLKSSDSEVITLRLPRLLNEYESFKDGAGLIKKLIKQFYISFSLTIQLFRIYRKNDIVFTGTNPAIFLCLMPILKHLLGVKWVLLVHDIFPDNLLAAGLIRKKSPLLRIAKSYFSWVYASPSKLLCIGRDMQALIRAKTKSRANTVFIPNWADENEIFPLARNELDFFNDNGLKNHIVFQFFGNIGRVQGVKNLLNAISKVSAKNAAFVFIGGGALVPSVLKFIKENPEKNVRFLGPMPLHQKNEGLAMCDVAIVSLEAGMWGLGVPSKSYFSLAAGKPIVAVVDHGSEIGLMIEEFPIGWRCDPDSPDQLAKLIDDVCASRRKIAEMSPREIFLKNYSEKVVLEKICKELKCMNYDDNL